MKTRLLVAAIFIVTGLFSTAVSAQIKSVYTDIYKSCKTVEKNELDVVRRCPGVGGYGLLVGYYDERFDITVINPSKKQFDQNYKGLIEGKFSDQASSKAEWRVKRVNGKDAPFALIVRLGVQDDAMVAKETSWLVVSKISGGSVCITDKIAPGPGQNDQARKAADASAAKPCLQ
jgi:hypothetical protein